MTGTLHTPTGEEDETVAKLRAALEEARGVDMRAAIEDAIEERKRELRRDARES